MFVVVELVGGMASGLKAKRSSDAMLLTSCTIFETMDDAQAALRKLHENDVSMLSDETIPPTFGVMQMTLQRSSR